MGFYILTRVTDYYSKSEDRWDMSIGTSKFFHIGQRGLTVPPTAHVYDLYNLCDTAPSQRQNQMVKNHYLLMPL